MKSFISFFCELNVFSIFPACAGSPALPPLPGALSCHLTSSCTGLECCVFSSRLGQTFRAHLDIDPCTYRITVGIDNWTFTELSQETIRMLNSGILTDIAPIGNHFRIE